MKNPNILVGVATIALLAGAGVAQEYKKSEDPNAPGAVPQPAPTVTPPVPEMKTGSPNSWFKRTKLFMGEFLNKESVSGKFKFANPTDKAIQWQNLNGTCQCVRAVIRIGDETYELSKKPVANSLHKLEKKGGKTVRKVVRFIEIGPKVEGEVEVHMEMGGLQGYKEASLLVDTTDEDLKQFTLAWQAKGVKLFEITPNDVFLNNMTWEDKRTFRFIVESPVKPDFKLLEHEPLPDYIKVSKAEITRPNGNKAWQVDGTYGPNADPKAGGAAIKFKTDWGGRVVTLNVIATVTPPISIKPGTFLSFGKIRKGEGAEQKITFVPNKKFDLSVTSVTFPKLTFDKKYISATSERVGKNLVVTVKIAPEVKGSYLIRGSVEVSLNHPSMKGKIFSFNGILR